MAIAPVNLTDVAAGSGGFVITGISRFELSGRSLASVGDMNGDGFSDLVIGTYGSNRTYVVFGQATGFGARISLADVAAGTGGFVIQGPNSSNPLGYSVASAGDINGDGFDDLVIGERYADQPGKQDSGKSYVVFGKGSGFAASIDLVSLEAGSGGFVINGQNSFDRSGTAVAPAGDVNGDGFDDLIIGAPNADGVGTFLSGKSFVVFGKGTGFGASIDLSAIAAGTGGFAITGITDVEGFGASVASAGDVNGDGFDDLVIGGPTSFFGTGNPDFLGNAYVIFGKDTGFGTGIVLSDILAGSGGFGIIGHCKYDRT